MQYLVSIMEGAIIYPIERIRAARRPLNGFLSRNHRVNSIKAAQKGAKAFVNEEKSKKNDGIPGQISMFGEEVK